MEYKNYDLTQGKLHTLKTDKFKVCTMVVLFKSKIKPETASKRNILFDLLSDGDEKFKTDRNFLIKLEELFNTRIFTVQSRRGKLYETEIVTRIINPKYASETLLEDSIKLTFDSIKNPNLNEEKLKQAKEKRLIEIKKTIENPIEYLISQTISETDQTTAITYPLIGREEEIKRVTLNQLKEYHQEVLNEDEIHIFVVGDLDMDNVYNLINKHNIFKNKNKVKALLTERVRSRKLRTYEENYPSSQTHIALTLNTKNLTSRERDYTLKIYNRILGSGSLNTKLYKNLRVGKQLCYSVSSKIFPNVGIIGIVTSVDNDSKDEAINLIRKSINEMKNNITDEELNIVKNQIRIALKEVDDDLNSLIDDLIDRNLYKKADKETILKIYESITKEEIYALHNKITEYNLYTLLGENK